MSSDKKFIFFDVLLPGFGKTLSYLGTGDIIPGDYVLVPLREKEAVGLVTSAEEYDEEDAPYPVKKTKSVIRKVHLDEEDYREECDTLFMDEDSIYEVLDDGTYKLFLNQYEGKGRVLILENTSVIGKGAFAGRENMTTIELPDSIRVIERNAFESCELTEITIPEGVERIEKDAFSWCENLKKVHIPSSVGYVDEDAFRDCYELRKILSDKRGEFKLDDSGYLTRRPRKKASAGQKNKKELLHKYYKKLKNAYEEYPPESDHMTIAEENGMLTVEIVLRQASRDSTLVKERIETAESLSEGTDINIVIKDEDWEVKSTSGKSIGEIDSLFGSTSLAFLNRIEIINAKIASVIPKSKRSVKAKYASVSVSFNIVEKTLPDGLSKEEQFAMTQFAYVVEHGEVRLIKWIGSSKTGKLVIPATLEGKPVVSLASGFLNPDLLSGIKLPDRLEELVISEGVKRLEAKSLFNYDLRYIKLISFPASLEFIHDDVFFDHSETLGYIGFIAPEGSYAENFLKKYRLGTNRTKLLKIVNDHSEGRYGTV